MPSTSSRTVSATQIVFHHGDLAVHTEMLLSYIRFCMDNVTVERRIRVFPSQKPWMTSHIRALRRTRNAAFRSGDRAHYSAAITDLRRGIREAKLDYKRKIQNHLSNNNSWQVWQGIQQLT